MQKPDLGENKVTVQDFSESQLYSRIAALEKALLLSESREKRLSQELNTLQDQLRKARAENVVLNNSKIVKYMKNLKKVSHWFSSRISDMDFGGTDPKRLISGLQWFKKGSIFDQESPTKHAIRITDVIVARASALLTHISLMLAVSTLVFQYWYPLKSPYNNYDALAYIMISEILAYLLLTLLCLRAIYLTGPSIFSGNNVLSNIVGDLQYSKNLFEDLMQAKDKNDFIGELVSYYSKEEFNREKSIFLLDNDFSNYTLLVLARHRAYLRALNGTFLVTIVFVVTTIIKFISVLTSPH